MCGVNIIYNFDGKPVEKNKILNMNRALHHRGPDDNDIFITDGAALGHTRLSIVDIDHGQQPMHSQNGRYVITYNGEIYNHAEHRRNLKNLGIPLKSSCDTEVILENFSLDQEKCLSKLRGMFAFAIFDKSSGELFAARDRMGIKPFYYFFDGNTFIAASEIKAIFASGLVTPELNQASIRQHFNYQFSVSPQTSFKNVFELPPGHYLTLGADKKLLIKQYWDLEFPEEGEYETDDFEFWKKEFDTALHEAAETHTIGDVPIGSYLSGGLDSSTTTLLLKEHYPKSVQTFSIHFTNPNSDESYAYRPVAEHLGLENSELTMDDDRTGGYFELLEDCVYHLEQPQRMAVDIPHFLLSNHVNQSGYKVVYTGDGADEILAGYDCFRQDNIRLWGNEQDSEEARESYYYSDFSQHFSEDYLSLLLKLHKPSVQSDVISNFGCYPVWYDMWQVLKDNQKDLFVGNNYENDQHQMAELMSRVRPKLKNRHRINQSLYLEMKTRLPNWILWKSDRLSMAHSVEARVPFLDHPLVELAARMPPDYKLKEMSEKYVLKEIVSAHLPHIPGDYKKRGFYTPIKEWFFQEQHRDQLEDYFSIEKLEETGLFNPATVRKMLNELISSPTPTDMNQYYKSMQLEWTLMLVLTSQMLHKLFITKEAPCFHDI